MASFDYTLTPAPILGGADISIGGNRIVERADLALVSVATPQGGDAALANAVKAGWGLDLPSPTVSTVSGDARAVASARDQLLLLFPHDGPDAEPVVQAKLNGAGYTTDQTDAFVVLEISGPDTLTALERLCPLDVGTWPEGGAGRTVMEHMGAWVIRLSADRFLLMSASSSARSFLHAVKTSFKWVM